jgi:hypothetical protein
MICGIWVTFHVGVGGEAVRSASAWRMGWGWEFRLGFGACCILLGGVCVVWRGMVIGGEVVGRILRVRALLGLGLSALLSTY